MKWLAMSVLVVLFGLVYWAGTQNPNWLRQALGQESPQEQEMRPYRFPDPYRTLQEDRRREREWRQEQRMNYLERELERMQEREEGRKMGWPGY